MLFIDPQNNYPRHIGDLQIAFPDWQIGDEIPTGWQIVEYAEIPSVGLNEIYYEASPILKNGKLTQNLIVRPMTLEEIAKRDEISRLRDSARGKIANGETLTPEETNALVL